MAYKLKLKRGLESALPTGDVGEPLWTTDTFDLYIGKGTSNQRYQKYIASGTSAQFLKGDGTLDSNTYALDSAVVHNTGTETIAGTKTFSLAPKLTSGLLIADGSLTTLAGHLGIGATMNSIVVKPSAGLNNYLVFSTAGSGYIYTFPANSGVIALTSDISGMVTGTGTTNYLPKWTSGSAIGNSLVYDSGTQIGISTSSPSAYGTQRFLVLGNGAASQVARFTDGANGDLYFDFPSQSICRITAQYGTAGTLVFASGVSNNETLRITSTGNLILNSTSDNGNRLQVTGSASFSGQLVQTLGDNQILYTNTSATTGYQYMRMVSTGASLIWGIDANPTASVFTGSLANSAVIGNGKNAPFHIATNAIVRLTVDAPGNLGLGVTPSAWSNPFKAIESGSSTTQSFIGFQDNANAIKLGTNNYYSSPNYLYKFNGSATRFDINDTSFIWNTAPSGTASTAVTFTQAMTLDASGRLGIGTASPTFKLQVYDAAGTSMVVGAATGKTYVYGDDAGGTIGTISAIPLRFATNSVESARLTAAGRLLLGTTTEGTELLQVNGTGRFSGAILINCPVNVNQGNLVITSTDNDASGLSFKVRTSPSDPTNSRSWMLHSNYSAAGTLEILRSTTATGNPTTVALKFDGSTGAATFSSSVTAQQINLTSGYGVNIGDFQIGAITSDRFYVYNNTLAIDNFKIIPSTGAATFSSSVTAGGDIIFTNTNNSIKYGSSRFFLYNATNTYIGDIDGLSATASLILRTNGTDKVTLTSGGNLLVGTATDSGQKFQTLGTGYFSGNVSIGTTTPFGTATNRTVFSVNGTTDVVMNVGAGGSQRAYLYASSTYADLGTIGLLPLVFSPNNIEQMRIKSNGIINLSNVPSSATGLSAGDIYKDASGFLKIV